MKKILLTLALSFTSHLYANNTNDHTSRQGIQEYINKIKKELDASENEAMTYMSQNSHKLFNASPDQKNTINNAIKVKLKTKFESAPVRLSLEQYQNKLSGMDDTGLLALHKDLHQHNKEKIEPFVETTKQKIRKTIDDIDVLNCPKKPLTSQIWTNLKNNGLADLEINEQIHKFYLNMDDKKNFPYAIQGNAWKKLIDSLPFKEEFDIKNIFKSGNLVICHYKYPSSAANKEYIIRIHSIF